MAANRPCIPGRSRFRGLLVLLVAASVLVSAFVVGSPIFWKTYYYEPTSETRTFHVHTRDGCKLALHYYQAHQESEQPPVILIHGLGSNRYAFELPHAPSLSLFLQDAGINVWVAELRGSGESCGSPEPSDFLALNWGFNDHLYQDIPAVIDFVRRQGRTHKVHLIGHSMGGMLILVHAGLNPSDALASVITLGSSIFLDDLESSLALVFLKLKKLFLIQPICPLYILSKCAIPIAHICPSVLLNLFEPDNIEPHVLRQSLALGEETLSPTKLWGDFANFRERGEVSPAPVKQIIEGLNSCEAPILLIGGSRDHMVTAGSIQRTFDAINASGTKMIRILGKSTGCRNDYGHMDLRVGKHAAEEVFPVVLDWLNSSHRSPKLVRVGMKASAR